MGCFKTNRECKAVEYFLNFSVLTNNKRVLLLRQFTTTIINI
jgi:hypothetical protein